MGNLLEKPNTEFLHGGVGKGHGNLRYGVSSMQGWRPEMEDAHVINTTIESLPQHSLFGVFDGHGGRNAAIFAADNIVAALANTEQCKQYVETGQTNIPLIEAALQQAFVDVDAEMRKSLDPASNPVERSGCTAIAVLVTPTHIICANAGDSRAILSRGNTVHPLSFDHKPWNPIEKTRIEKAGGCVTMKRVDGELAVSRALGDFQYKDPALPPQECKVTAHPDITTFERVEDSDEFIVLACDGIWDVMTNEEVQSTIVRYANLGEKNPRLMCEELMTDCLTRHSRDNMSAIVAYFPPFTQFVKEGGGVNELREKREEAEEAEANK